MIYLLTWSVSHLWLMRSVLLLWESSGEKGDDLPSHMVSLSPVADEINAIVGRESSGEKGDDLTSHMVSLSPVADEISVIVVGELR